MFLPVAFVHPLRVRRLRLLTLVVTGVWGAAAVAAVAEDLAAASVLVKTALVVTGCYFLLCRFFARAARSRKEISMVKAIRVHQPGGPDAFVIEDVDLPAPGPSEVQIRHSRHWRQFHRRLPPHRRLSGGISVHPRT